MPRRCHRHAIEVPVHGGCSSSATHCGHPRSVADMSPEERLAEFESWAGDEVTLEVEIDRLVPRLNALVGRSIFVHEFAGGGLKIAISGK